MTGSAEPEPELNLEDLEYLATSVDGGSLLEPSRVAEARGGSGSPEATVTAVTTTLVCEFTCAENPLWTGHVHRCARHRSKGEHSRRVRLALPSSGGRACPFPCCPGEALALEDFQVEKDTQQLKDRERQLKEQLKDRVERIEEVTQQLKDRDVQIEKVTQQLKDAKSEKARLREMLLEGREMLQLKDRERQLRGLRALRAAWFRMYPETDVASEDSSAPFGEEQMTCTPVCSVSPESL